MNRCRGIEGDCVSYGLVAPADGLPAFVVLADPKGLPSNPKGNFTLGFLPQAHSEAIDNMGGGGAEPIQACSRPDRPRPSAAERPLRNGMSENSDSLFF